MKNLLLLSIFILLVIDISTAKELHVGENQEYSTLEKAAEIAQPGDAIIIHNGTYTHRENIYNLNGEIDNPILIYAEDEGKVIYSGQSEAWHLSSCSYIFIAGFIFQNQTSNGVNIDDSGNFDQSTHHITIKNCTFKDMDASGNNDMLKLSGLDDFIVENCRFQNGAAEGSGIDMVGCHNGIFIKNRFEQMGSNSIQVKGGSQYINILQNTFIDGGRRTLNLGGSTGLEYFRPLDAIFEAADISVNSNIFIRSWAPIAYVGSVRVKVINNTFYKPENWVFRILQETVDTSRFLACGDNEFSNNIIYFGNSLHRFVNIGIDTRPESFIISNNLWYNFEDNNFSGPNLPVTETNAIIQQDPQFIDSENYNFDLMPNSPAIGNGNRSIIPELDFNSRYFSITSSSIGAFEPEGVYKDFTASEETIWIYDISYCGNLYFQEYTLYNKFKSNNKELSEINSIFQGDIILGANLHTNNGIVQVKYHSIEGLHPLYNFNLLRGDTMNSLLYNTLLVDYSISKFIIDSIKYRHLAGQTRKVLLLHPIDDTNNHSNFGNPGIIIEGIYSLNSNLYGNDYFPGDSGNDLRCFRTTDSDDRLYVVHFKDYPCDSTTVSAIDFHSLNPTIYPNPSSEVVTIDFGEEFTGIIEIFNISGKRLFNKRISNKYKLSFSIKDFKEGIYTMYIVNKKQKITTKLIILK